MRNLLALCCFALLHSGQLAYASECRLVDQELANSTRGPLGPYDHPLGSKFEYRLPSNPSDSPSNLTDIYLNEACGSLPHDHVFAIKSQSSEGKDIGAYVFEKNGSPVCVFTAKYTATEKYSNKANAVEGEHPVFHAVRIDGACKATKVTDYIRRNGGFPDGGDIFSRSTTPELCQSKEQILSLLNSYQSQKKEILPLKDVPKNPAGSQLLNFAEPLQGVDVNGEIKRVGSISPICAKYFPEKNPPVGGYGTPKAGGGSTTGTTLTPR